MSNSNRETLVGVLLSCSIILNSLCWIIRRNSLASSKDTFFLPKPFPFSANLPTGTSSSGVGLASLVSFVTTFAFLLSFAGCTDQSGTTKMRPLRIAPLSLVILVTLAESESMPVASSFLPTTCRCVALSRPRRRSYPTRALDIKLQVDWARDAREGPRVLMSLRVVFGPMG